VVAYDLTNSARSTELATAELNMPSYNCTDNALLPSRIDHLRHIFRAESPYWREHDYDAIGSNSSRRVGYFSYIYPFKQQLQPNCSVEFIIDELFQIAKRTYPELETKATVGKCLPVYKVYNVSSN
jgi:hypothetical protein